MKQFIMGAEASKAAVIEVAWPPKAEGVYEVDRELHKKLFEVAKNLVGGREVTTISIFATDEEKED